MPFPSAPDETKRLEELRNYRILDTPPEPAFERLTHLAACHFNTPVAFISFIDTDRQWFKSCYGADLCERERKLTFCDHAILSSKVMVVPDATLDPRFKDNAFVTGPPYIRFYVGAPLKSPQGHIVGTICIFDTVPRQMSMTQQSVLADLAAMVMDELELRRQTRELHENQSFY